MAQFQILYWRDIPSQVKTWDDFDEVKVELPQRFATRIDHAAESLGLAKADDYLAQWKWTDAQERPGTPDEVAAAVQAELEAKWP
jgi:hypothetical protein